MSAHDVILTEHPRVSLRGVGKPIAKLLRRPLVDITTHLRDVVGVVYSDLEEAQAHQIAAILTEAGQPAVAVPAAERFELPRPMRVRTAAVEPEEFVVWLPKEEAPVAVGFESIVLVSVGVIRLYDPEIDIADSANFKDMVSGLGATAPEVRDHLKAQVADELMRFGASDAVLPPQTGEALRESSVGKLPLEYHIDLVINDPLFVLRISEAHVSFEYLEGATNSTLTNFHMLFCQLADRVRDALTGAAYRFGDWSIVEADLFQSVRDFEHYNRWQLQVARLTGARPSC